MTQTLSAALEREHREIDEALFDALSDRAPEALEDRRTALTAAIEALRRHIYFEEELLFPPLRDAGLIAPLFVMVREHGQLWRTLDALQFELRVSGSSAAARQLCHELTVQLQHHNAKEEQIVYPQADAVFSASDSAPLKAFLADGQLPEGWVCEGARAPTRASESATEQRRGDAR